MWSNEDIRDRIAFAIPEWWQEIREVKNIQDRVAEELFTFAELFFLFVEGKTPQTAQGEFLAKWELFVGITPDESVSLSERRSAVIAKLRGYPTVTKESIVNLLAAYQYGSVSIFEDSGNYTIEITFDDPLGIPIEMDIIEALLSELLPAHLTIKLNAQGNPHNLLTKWTHAELEPYTHVQIKTLAALRDKYKE